MGLYGDKKDYEQLVKEKIYKAKLLYALSEEDRNLVSTLLSKKEEIMNENGLWANLKLKRINKKIEKIQKKYNS